MHVGILDRGPITAARVSTVPGPFTVRPRLSGSAWFQRLTRRHDCWSCPVVVLTPADIRLHDHSEIVIGLLDLIPFAPGILPRKEASEASDHPHQRLISPLAILISSQSRRPARALRAVRSKWPLNSAQNPSLPHQQGINSLQRCVPPTMSPTILVPAMFPTDPPSAQTRLCRTQQNCPPGKQGPGQGRRCKAAARAAHPAQRRPGGPDPVRCHRA